MHAGTIPDPAEGETRRDFIHVAAAAGAAGAVAGICWPLIDQMEPSDDVLAMSSVDVDYTKVALGQQMVVKWRGKPVFIRHRTPKEIAAAVDVDWRQLRDPQPDSARVKPGMAEWLIVIGICTHLGCVPTFGEGDYGGWLCPCHGSQYDTSGRIRKGPAPKNLYLPDYAFAPGGKVKIG